MKKDPMEVSEGFVIGLIIVWIVIAGVLSFLTFSGYAEEPKIAYVTADQLNGRSKPNKHGFIEARFDYGDALTITGEWSKDHNWVKVVGGENGTVWVNIKYVSETIGAYTVQNTSFSKIKIRKRPVDGRISGYLKRGETLEIDREVNGWGHSAKGWIDLSLVEEIDGGE